MPRGGKRPGAGAPKGNLNALKHGRHSERLRKARLLANALAQIPEVRELLLALRRQHEQEIRQTRQTARDLLYELFLGIAPRQEKQLDQTLEQLQRFNRHLLRLQNESELSITNPLNQTPGAPTDTPLLERNAQP